MRLELSGSLIHPDPSVIKFATDGNFDTVSYIELGYTHFEVICIGGGGGAGGGIDSQNTDNQIRNYGGAGGGGGFQRVRGLLSALPVICPVVIGAAGTAGVEHISNPALTTNGGDGGYSTFNTTTCRASGGKGGRRVQTNSDSFATLADGGDGGIGNRTIAGGGGAGGIAGTPSPSGPGALGTAGIDGTIFNNIGKGGGGGAGGVGKWVGITCNPATAGGRGSYNPGDTSVYGPGDLPSADADSGALNIVPGAASGAKASPLNGLPTVYGRSGAPGAVILYLTANVIATPIAPESTPFGQIRFSMVFGKSVDGQSSTITSDSYGAGLYSAGLYVGTPRVFGQVSKIFTFGKSVAGSGSTPAAKQTEVAQISLASHLGPSQRTNHTIKFRARTLTGSTGVIKAALYEGSTNRSGDLTSSPLSNSLADYTLFISNSAAAAITDYSNLTIRIWGYDAAGNALVFEVANVYLELPTTTSKQTAVAEISLASHGVPSQRTNHTIKIKARTTTGSTGVIKAALYEGSTNRSGVLTSTPLTNSLVEHTLVISNAAAAAITSYSNLSIRIWGYDAPGNPLVFEVANVYLNLPTP